MATEPLLLIGAYRPEDAPVALTRLVGQWQRDGVLQRMPINAAFVPLYTSV